MRLRRSARLLLALIPLGLVLAPLAAAADEGAAPLIKSARRGAPKPGELTIEQSAGPAVSPETTLDNYRQLLALDPDPKTRGEAMRRIADIEMKIADDHGYADDESKRDIADAIGLYEQLLKEQPNAPGNDSVLYQLARAYRNSNRPADAIKALQQLEHDYPESMRVDDSHFMAGQLLFAARQFPQAEREYSPLVRKGPWAGPLFEPAEYKYAWTLLDEDEFDEAAAAFVGILEHLLPANTPSDPEAALKLVAADKSDMARDSLRGLELAFMQLGGAVALDDFFEKHPEPRFSPMLYIALGETYLDKHRYSDAATTFELYVKRHPHSGDAPTFEAKTIEAFREGGFSEAALTAMGKFAEAYQPDSSYWKGHPPPPEVLHDLHEHLLELARYHHELAQKDPVKNHGEFVIAADWYRKLLKDFPKDPQSAEIHLALADALLDGGQTRTAADEYMHAAYDSPPGPKSADAAYAAVQAYERYEQDAPDADKKAAGALAADAEVRLADHYPDHPEKLKVLTRAAEHYYKTGDLQKAIDIGGRVAAVDPPAPGDLLRASLEVVADSQFSLGKYGDAEKSYGRLLNLIPHDDPLFQATEERHTASIYKSADAARQAGDLKAAAEGYQRLGQIARTDAVREKADYDAAATYLQMQDWTNAEQLLEAFPRLHPDSSYLPDVDKKLAVAYQKDNKLAEAAAVYSRIAQRTSESADTRKDMSWLAAQLYDQAGNKTQAATAYQAYLSQYPEPFDRAMDVRHWLADYYEAQHDEAQHKYWLHQIVTADAEAGGARDDRSRAYAARATLEFAREQAAAANAIELTLPIKKSLAIKKKAMETAIDSLTQAANSGFGDVTTAATYELGELYRNFSQSIIDSEKPRNLKGDALDDYNLMLDDQAEPFIDKAIQTQELNLGRIKSGMYDEWIARSVEALAQLAPAKYGKVELREPSYDQAH